MKILTLCGKCRDLCAESYSVKPYVFDRATTQPDKKCACCKKPFREMGMYIIDNKRGRK